MPTKIYGLLIILLISLMLLSCSSKESPSLSSESGTTQDSGTVKRESQAGGFGLSEKEVQEMHVSKDGNSLPRITKVKVMPEVFKPGDTLYLDADADDPDGDDVTLSYEWYKNGELVSTERQIKSSLKRGDKLLIKLKPFDGKDYGKEITLKREVLNIPPIIKDHRDYKFDGNVFTYQVKASDPDGDVLTYSLKSSPSGMTIDQQGFIKWIIPADFRDKVPFTVSVNDGHGGEAVQSFEITPQPIRQ